MYNDWQLAIAAYNGGPSVVRNAIIRSGGKSTFWEIKPYLPVETQNYVPAFIAAVYLMNYANDYQLSPSEKAIYYHQTDTILISKPLYFNDLCLKLNVPIDIIRFLNPSYKQDYIPQQASSIPLVLPADKIADFIKLNQTIFQHELPKQQLLASSNNKKAINYTVRKGDYLTKVAIAFRCSAEDIKKWNNLQSNELTTGNTLLIWCPVSDELSIIE
jgi:membrane-bound lytic murein transglycosylase D